MRIYLNGKFVAKKDAKVSVFDHGFLYGDGVFEGIRFYNGKVFKLAEHIERLFESARAICMDIGATQKELCRWTVETIAENALRDGYVRLLVSRGEGSLGLNPFTCKGPNIIIIASSISLYPKEYYEKGLNIKTGATRASTPASLNPGIKSMNYLNNILAKIEAVNAGCLETIMLNEDGFIAECSGDNIFFVKKNTLITPPSSAGALRGITRDTVLDIARQGEIPVQIRPCTLFEAYNADECFLTGTAAEIIPVVKIDGRTIANGKPGKMTKLLADKYKKLTNSTGVEIYT